MKRNFSLLFFLKRRNTAQNGSTSVYLRITVDKKRSEAATGKQCKEEDWDNGKFKGRNEKAKTLNLFLHQLELKVQEAHRQIFIRNEELTAQTLMNEFLGKKCRIRKLKEAFQVHNQEIEGYHINKLIY